MLTLKKVKELVEAPSHAKRTPSPKMLFVPDETIAGDRSTSNADWWICDFYDSAGGRQCGGIFGTGSSNDSASMVHIRRGET